MQGKRPQQTDGPNQPQQNGIRSYTYTFQVNDDGTARVRSTNARNSNNSGTIAAPDGPSSVQGFHTQNFTNTRGDITVNNHYHNAPGAPVNGQRMDIDTQLPTMMAEGPIRRDLVPRIGQWLTESNDFHSNRIWSWGDRNPPPRRSTLANGQTSLEGPPGPSGQPGRAPQPSRSTQKPEPQEESSTMPKGRRMTQQELEDQYIRQTHGEDTTRSRRTGGGLSLGGFGESVLRPGSGQQSHNASEFGELSEADEIAQEMYRKGGLEGLVGADFADKVDGVTAESDTGHDDTNRDHEENMEGIEPRAIEPERNSNSSDNKQVIKKEKQKALKTGEGDDEGNTGDDGDTDDDGFKRPKKKVRGAEQPLPPSSEPTRSTSAQPTHRMSVVASMEDPEREGYYQSTGKSEGYLDSTIKAAENNPHTGRSLRNRETPATPIYTAASRQQTTQNNTRASFSQARSARGEVSTHPSSIAQGVAAAGAPKPRQQSKALNQMLMESQLGPRLDNVMKTASKQNSPTKRKTSAIDENIVVSNALPAIAGGPKKRKVAQKDDSGAAAQDPIDVPSEVEDLSDAPSEVAPPSFVRTGTKVKAKAKRKAATKSKGLDVRGKGRGKERGEPENGDAEDIEGSQGEDEEEKE